MPFCISQRYREIPQDPLTDVISGDKGNVMKRIMLFAFVLWLGFFSQLSPALSQGTAASLPFNGMGCWVQTTSIDNPYIYDSLFSWYIMVGKLIPSFKNPEQKPILLAYAGTSPDSLITNMLKYKKQIVGVVWDKEQEGIVTQEQAEKDLKKVYSKARQLGLTFGVVALTSPRASLKKNGVSYANAKTFCDFLLPMYYSQWSGMERPNLERSMGMQRSEAEVPLIALIALETSATLPPRTLVPQEVISIYKGLPVDGFGIYNAKGLNDDLIKALGSIAK
jgi:hypothetical protein